MNIERRYKKLEIRSEDDGRKLVGHAAVFDQLSDEIFGFREKIAPGAFKKTIKEADVRALFNHDANFVLGRNKAGTLVLAEDDKGLAVEIDVPDTQWARDLMVSVDRGDISQMSFGFRPIRQEWSADLDERTILEAELFDVSPVTFPAYPQTDVQAREATYRQAFTELRNILPTEHEESPVKDGHDLRDLRLRMLKLKMKGIQNDNR